MEEDCLSASLFGSKCRIWVKFGCKEIYLELYIVKKYLINPYLNIEIVDIVAIVKHSVVVRIWQIIW